MHPLDPARWLSKPKKRLDGSERYSTEKSWILKAEAAFVCIFPKSLSQP